MSTRKTRIETFDTDILLYLQSIRENRICNFFQRQFDPFGWIKSLNFSIAGANLKTYHIFIYRSSIQNVGSPAKNYFVILMAKKYFNQSFLLISERYRFLEMDPGLSGSGKQQFFLFIVRWRSMRRPS